MPLWDCHKVKEKDFRPEGGAGLSLEFQCNKDKENGSVSALINTCECIIADLHTFPHGQGIGTSVLPQVESALKKHGCKVAFALPMNETMEHILKRSGYEELEHGEHRYYWKKNLSMDKEHAVNLL